MRAKNTTKPPEAPRSIRYLLSADRRLQKISLRKLTERLKKTNPQARSAQTKPAAVAQPPVPPQPKAYSWRAIVVGMTCVMAAAALMTARQPSEEAQAGEPPVAASTPVRTTAMAAPPESTKKAVLPKPAAPIAPAPAASATKPTQKPVTLTSAATPTADVSKAITQAAKPAAGPVTITGCLERDGEAFWLKDTSGAEAPRSRSWKTGFLKRRSTRVELVDAGHTLKLSAHVGERVAATGTLMDRELRARSVRRMAGACN